MGDDYLKGQYYYLKLVFNDTDEESGLLPNTEIPRGGAYWVQDIIENLKKYPQSPQILDDLEDFITLSWLGVLAQRVGMCVPSGCTDSDTLENYRQLYTHISATFEPTTQIQVSVTEDYFYEGYLEGNIHDGFYNILPESWTWGQWLYV